MVRMLLAILVGCDEVNVASLSDYLNMPKGKVLSLVTVTFPLISFMQVAKSVTFLISMQKMISQLKILKIPCHLNMRMRIQTKITN